MHTGTDQRHVNKQIDNDKGIESSGTSEETAWAQLEVMLTPHLNLHPVPVSPLSALVDINVIEEGGYTGWVNPFNIGQLHEMIHGIESDTSPFGDGLIVIDDTEDDRSTDDLFKAVGLLRKYYVSSLVCPQIQTLIHIYV